MTLAKRDASYANQGLAFYPQGNNAFAGVNAALNWDRKTPALPVLATQIAQLNRSLGLSMSRFQTDAELYFDNLLNNKMQDVSQTKGGLYWWKGDSDGASLNPALNAAFIADLYSGFATTPAKTTAYRSLADSQWTTSLATTIITVLTLWGSIPTALRTHTRPWLRWQRYHQHQQQPTEGAARAVWRSGGRAGQARPLL